MSRTRPSFVLLLALASTALALDLGTKRWAEGALASPRAVIDGVLAFALAHNTGGAFSILRAASEAVKMPLFVAVSVAAVGAIVWIYARSQPQQWATRIGLALILGGALGNLVDRVRYGYVVDFIAVSAKWGGAMHAWPTFNVADMAICVGVALLFFDRGANRPRYFASLPPA
jgi:signal peptidase II